MSNEVKMGITGGRYMGKRQFSLNELKAILEAGNTCIYAMSNPDEKHIQGAIRYLEEVCGLKVQKEEEYSYLWGHWNNPGHKVFTGYLLKTVPQEQSKTNTDGK